MQFCILLKKDKKSELIIVLPSTIMTFNHYI